jgi:hypothetical protein
MRKASLILSAIASLLLVIAFALFFIPAVGPYMPYGFAPSGLGYWAPSRLEFLKFFDFAETYGSHPIMWVFLLGVLAVLGFWVAHLIAIMKSRRRKELFVNLVWLLAGFLAVDLFVYGFLPGMWATKSVSSIGFAAMFETGSYGPEYANYMTCPAVFKPLRARGCLAAHPLRPRGLCPRFASDRSRPVLPRHEEESRDKKESLPGSANDGSGGGIQSRPIRQNETSR